MCTSVVRTICPLKAAGTSSNPCQVYVKQKQQKQQNLIIFVKKQQENTKNTLLFAANLIYFVNCCVNQSKGIVIFLLIAEKYVIIYM